LVLTTVFFFFFENGAGVQTQGFYNARQMPLIHTLAQWYLIWGDFSSILSLPQLKMNMEELGMVVHASIPNCSGSRNLEDHCLRPVQAKS
jgi:hypothetical protein